MEVMDDLSGSNDHSMIIKGKRAKRGLRPSSPVGSRPVVATFSSSCGGGGEDGEVLGYFYPLIPSSTTSTSDTSTTSTDQEDDDQDIANCLILLAQGDSGRKRVHHPHQHQDVEIKMEKFSSRRFNEMATSTTGGKVGFFVYECKTCNRTFPSFQALGGHRASHKKPKVTTMEEKKTAILTPPPPTTTTNDHHHHHHEEEAEESVEVKEEKAQESTSKCLEKNTNNPNRAKNHECSICGAEFSSGQALGGHMRRHRNPPPMTSTTNAAKVSMIVDQTSPSSAHDDDLDEASRVVKKSRNNIFPLDLNLPAPAEDDINLHRELKFQQHHLVLTAPALVDCHY